MTKHVHTTRYHPRFQLVAICISLILSVLTVDANIAYFGINLYDDQRSSTSDLQLTLWWNHTVYSCTLYPTTPNATYVCDRDDWNIVGEICDEQDAEYKLMIDNSDSFDAAIIGSITVATVPDPSTYYLYFISGWCIPKDQVPIGFTFISSWEAPDMFNKCTDTQTRNFNTICIDNDSAECAPGKMMMYFDSELPNYFVYDSTWEDASAVVVEDTFCSQDSGPSIPSTNIPTKRPSNDPSQSPAVQTVIPSDFSTLTPTRIPTITESSSTSSTTSPSFDSTVESTTVAGVPSLSSSPITTMVLSFESTSLREGAIDSSAVAMSTESQAIMSIEDKTSVQSTVFVIFIIIIVVSVLCVGALLCMLFRTRSKRQQQNRIQKLGESENGGEITMNKRIIIQDSQENIIGDIDSDEDDELYDAGNVPTNDGVTLRPTYGHTNSECDI